MKRFVFVLAAVAVLAGCGPRVSGAPDPYPPPPDYVVATVNAHFGDLGPGVVSCFYGIIWRESGYVAEAVGGGRYLGLTQIASDSAVWSNMAWNLGRPLNPFDPWDNLAAARSLYESWRLSYGNPFGPWAATRGGCR